MLGGGETFSRKIAGSADFYRKSLAEKIENRTPANITCVRCPKNIIAIIIIMDSRAYVRREGNGSFKSPALA